MLVSSSRPHSLKAIAKASDLNSQQLGQGKGRDYLYSVQKSPRYKVIFLFCRLFSNIQIFSLRGNDNSKCELSFALCQLG